MQEFLRGISPVSETTRRLGNVIDVLNQKVDEQMGALSRELYPSTLGEGLVPAFESFRNRFGTDLAIVIELDEELVKREGSEGSFIPEQVRLAAYRIAEEALTNAIEHAQASKVTVRLDSAQPNWLRVTVRDNGQGFDTERPASGMGMGMGMMQDYAEAVDGQFSVHSDPGLGTEIRAIMPLSRPVDEHLESSSETGGN